MSGNWRAAGKERRRTRDELLAATEAAPRTIQQDIQRRTKTPLSAAGIGQKVGKVIARNKMGKHFELTIADGGFRVARRSEAVAREADPHQRSPGTAPPEQSVPSYKGLAQVERAFRTLEGMDLRIRPIHPRTEARVRAHIGPCLLTYSVEWHLRCAAPGRAGYSTTRPSPWIATRAIRWRRLPPAAKRKTTERLDAEGLPIHSFRTRMAEPATHCRHRCRRTGAPDSPFITQETEPTLIQSRALQLRRLLPVPGC